MIGGRASAASVLLIAASLCNAPLDLGAQGRERQLHRADDPEGRLVAFYAAAMTFSPLGGLSDGARWSIGGEGTWIPRLSESQRRPGIDKPETTNLAPVLPRPRVAWRAPGDVIVEGSWIPPVRVGDAEANLGALALSRRVGSWRGIAFSPRLSAVAGRVRGAITCNAGTARAGGPTLALYYLRICHDRESDDWFEPRQLAGELVASREVRALRGAAYVVAGGRADRSRFDIGVQGADGRRDLDHPVIVLRDVRPHVAAGARWRVGEGFTSAAEWFYAPGSLATLRLQVGFEGGR